MADTNALRVLSEHRPTWEQSRDEPVGMWRCICGITYAPDDVDRFHKHLEERLSAAPEPGLDVERLAEAVASVTSLGFIDTEHGREYDLDGAQRIAAEYAHLSPTSVGEQP